MHPPSLFLRRIVALALFLFATAAPAADAPRKTLRVSAIPDEAPTELQRKFAPLGRYLEKETGLKVRFVPVTDYAAVVEGLATARLDLAWLGGFTFVQAMQRTGGRVTPIVQRAEDEQFTGKFIVPLASPAQTLEDLKGGSFVFGAPSSTSGHLMPRYFLMQAGIEPDRDFRTVAYSGAHDATVAYVASGRADAGVLNTSVWEKLIEEKRPNAARVRVLATTPPFYDYNWTVRDGLDPELVERLRQAFLKLDPARPEDREIMELQRASRFVPTQAANYQATEAAARAAGLVR